jgi:hypothetical protein
VLAANLENQADFELMRYSDNAGREALRRSQVFRQAARNAAAEARTLASAPKTPPAITTTSTSPASNK